MITVRNNVELRNQVKDFFQCNDFETVLDGPAETGKTFACCLMMHLDAMTYPGMQGVIIRKVRADMPGTVLQTFEKVGKVLFDKRVVTKLGGSHVERYQYVNGSEIWVGGLDRPGAVLSSERDRAYFCQLEQIPLNAYEYVLSRCTGRAGNTPFSKVYSDCNPDHPKHWIPDRVKSGSLRMFKTTHKDNPRLWDGSNWTRHGLMTIEILNRLTGVRKKRLLDGLWVGVEGLVYECYNDAAHIIDPFEITDDWQRSLSIDWGFRDPMVVQWWATRGEKTVMYREIYTTGRSIESVAETAARLSKNEKIEMGVSDVDPQKQMTFMQSFGRGLRLLAANKKPGSVSLGIHDRVAPRLQDRNILFFRNALVEKDLTLESRHLPVCTTDEFSCYAWPEDTDGKPRKEIPIDANNHGMDAMRYHAGFIDILKQSKNNVAGGW